MTRSCAVCGSEEFMCIDGFYYCSVCNVQSVQHEQEIEEEMENLDLAMVSEIRGSKSKPEKQVLHPQLPYEKDLRNYTAILNCQTDALISLGFAPIIKKSAKVLWIQMVRQAIKDDANDPAPSKCQTPEEGDSVVQSDEAEATSDKQSPTENDSILKSQKVMPSLFRAITTLAVCWFACRLCGYKILVSDICLLVRQRLLPFYADTFPDEVRESAFGRRSFIVYELVRVTEFYIRSLPAEVHLFHTEDRSSQSNKIRSLSNVYWKFCLISRTFDFLENTVPVEAEEMIARFSLDLNLPGEIFQTAVDVLRLLDVPKVINLHNDALPKFTSQRMPVPLEMKAMCVIIIALKGLFKLNDSHEQEMALEALRHYENKNTEDGRLPFLFPCWLLHNELKMAIVEGSSVEEVLSPLWFDSSAKIVNRVVAEFYTVSHLRRDEHAGNHMLSDIFQTTSSSFGSIGSEAFSFRCMHRRFESFLAKHSSQLDRDSVALFCFNFASTFVADCPKFPDGRNYGFHPFISHSSSDNRSYQFKRMSLTIFSATFNRLLELCSKYLFCLPNLLFLVLQNMEMELTPSLSYPRYKRILLK
ncbi:hypothetical protein TTRE_0000632001 [Trichuris trichiura]|uniref:TATA box-binding protein-associated factor RNA polymerase I subunit B n=1 Tax=Trichuris trichiura TaxID=36087 RepID=A0A077ZDU0_TRITR|nr:hypothetical protein TTRE_0000632001 [Trichuris trichiura]